MPGESLTLFIPMILMLVFFYFFIIRPQKRREKEVIAMRESLQAGDHIVTIGGILGRIVKVKEDIVVLEIGSQKETIEILKSAIGTVSKKKDVANASVDGTI
ncbi:MAG: preprotein translocase subunit YajC [Tissierellia bacterium]|nr:preprotein translocase subunit YajC [Tissierellia bacterium]